jgi:hypothetical protein
LAEVARGTDKPGKFGLGNLFHGGWGEQFRPAQIGDGAFDIHPSCILNEDCANDNFEGRSARPPVLLAVSLKQRLKILRQDGQAFRSGRGVCARAGLAEQRTGAGGSGQSGARAHLFRTISTHGGQVKNTTLSLVSAPLFNCTGISEFTTRCQNRSPRTQRVCYVWRWVHDF